MATARREYFGKLLEPGLDDIFYNEYDAVPSMLPEIYNMGTSDQPFEEALSIGAMGTFPKFKGTVEYDRPYEGYSKIIEFPEYADGFKIERKLYDDDRYDIINQRPAGLAIQARRRRESDGALLFNNAASTTATDIEGITVDISGGDGKALCASDHPSKAPHGPTARSNTGTLKLNHTNLQKTKNLMRRTVDDRGNKFSVVPDTLLVGIDQEETAWELIQSEKKVNTAENNPNIHHGKYRLIVWDELADDDRWFLIDSRYARLFLHWKDRVPLEFAMEEAFDELVAKYRAYMRYNSVFYDWVWVYGQFPA